MILPNKMLEVEEVDSENPGSDSDSDSDSTGSHQKKRKLSNTEDLPDSGKSKILRKNKHLYRQPTTEELNQLRETENLFNSNLFRLQIEEVLKEVKLKPKTVERFQSWFNDFNNHFLDLDNGEEHSLLNLEWLEDLDVNLPIELKPQETKGSFQFLKCKPPNVIGSYKLDCCLNKNIFVDLVITIPAGFFVKNDSINHRYHRKRAIYLAIIASHLKTFDKISELKYTFSNGSEWKPAICITPEGKLGKDLQVVIHLICDPESFKLARFHLARNNVREAWFFHKNETEVIDDCPTPFYNSSVLQDLTSSINEEFLQSVILEKDNLKEAILLLKIWIRQRKLPISGYVLSMFLAYLVQQKRVNNVMSSYQIVRNTCIALINSEWDHKGISLKISQNTDDTPSIQDFQRHFPVVFVDCTGFYNICWRMTLGTYHALKYESSKAVVLLDNQNINSFLPLFMTPFQLCLQYDHILRFQNYADVVSKVHQKIPEDLKLDYGSEAPFLTTKIITEMLRKGLGKRISYVCEYVLDDGSNMSWPVTERLVDAKKKTEKKINFLFGIKLNGEEALQLIDKGPPANLPEAESFRAFWGEKSELRRFQDGSITEACMWDGNTLSERRLITRSIVSYLLASKYGIDDKNIVYIADQVECAIQGRGNGWFVEEEISLKAIEAFDQIRKELRALTDLPLDINSVTSTSPVSSYSDPCPPVSVVLESDRNSKSKPLIRGKCQLIKDTVVHQKSIKHHIGNKAIHAVVELGHSGKWPGDLDAFLRLKAAFNIHLADVITKQCNLVAHPYPAHFNVFKNGFIFTLKLAHRKEINLRRRISGPDGIVKYRDTDESLKLEYETVHLPRLRGALHGLHQQYSSYGAASCLAKRWLAAQLVDGAHFPPTLVELMVASTFVSPAPYAPPFQPLTAFLRFLRLISATDWTAQPLIINFNNELSREEIAEQEKKFQDSRSSLPALFVITPYQGDTLSQWSKHGPSANILARVRNLADVTLQFIEKSLLLESESLKSIFRPNLDGYSVIIHLEPHIVSGMATHKRSKGNKKINDSIEDHSSIPVIEFDPVQKYLTELRDAYDPFALFFHNTYGGDLIAVLWKPDVLSAKEFKVSTVNGCKPRKGIKQHELVVNTNAIIDDFLILGAGIVKSIEHCSN